MRSPILRRISVAVSKSTSTWLMPPCLPVTRPAAPVHGPLMTRARLPTQALVSNARLGPSRGPAISRPLLCSATPGSIWSPARPTQRSPIRWLMTMPPVEGSTRGTPSWPMRWAIWPITTCITRSRRLRRNRPAEGWRAASCIIGLRDKVVPISFGVMPTVPADRGVFTRVDHQVGAGLIDVVLRGVEPGEPRSEQMQDGQFEAAPHELREPCLDEYLAKALAFDRRQLVVTAEMLAI